MTSLFVALHTSSNERNVRDPVAAFLRRPLDWDAQFGFDRGTLCLQAFVRSIGEIPNEERQVDARLLPRARSEHADPASARPIISVAIPARA